MRGSALPTTAMLLVGLLATASAEQDCSLLAAPGEVGAVFQALNASGLALPSNTTALATVLLPTLDGVRGAFTKFVDSAAANTSALDDATLEAKMYAVLLAHLLPLPRAALAALAAAGPFPTALAQINGSGLANITVSSDLKTVRAALSNATILNTTELCGTYVYSIDNVLLPAPFAALPALSPANISAWFAGKLNATTPKLPSGGSGSGSTASPAPTAAPTPAPPSPTPAPASSSGITMAEVATHNTAASAWLVISGKVYDVTKFVPIHPGGSIILDYAGTDATAAFQRNHRGSSASSRLPAYYIGDLAA